MIPVSRPRTNPNHQTPIHSIDCSVQIIKVTIKLKVIR